MVSVEAKTVTEAVWVKFIVQRSVAMKYSNQHDNPFLIDRHVMERVLKLPLSFDLQDLILHYLNRFQSSNVQWVLQFGTWERIYSFHPSLGDAIRCALESAFNAFLDLSCPLDSLHDFKTFMHHKQTRVCIHVWNDTTIEFSLFRPPGKRSYRIEKQYRL